MKKHSIFKVMAIILLLVLVVTYFIPNRSGTIAYLPFGDLVTNYIQSFSHFYDIVVFFLTLGAFYSVLNKVGAYKKLLDSIVKKIKPNAKLMILISVIVFALISAFTGITSALIIFVPFVISIILLLGYDKLVAISSTIIPIIIGSIGGIATSFRDPNNYYGYSTVTFDEFVGIDKLTNIIPQIIILVLGILLILLFINKHIKDVENKKVKYELNDNSELLVTEVKGNYKDIKSWPLIVVLSLVLVLLILGFTPWNDFYGIDIFTKFHTWITEELVVNIKIKRASIEDFYIFKSIISTTFPAFGGWGELGTFTMAIILMLLSIIAIKFIYKIKFNDLMDYIAEGAKKMLPTVALIMVAYSILVCTYIHGFSETIITKVSSGGDINFMVASLSTMIGSILHTDLYYTVIGIFTPILSAVSDEAMFSVYSLAFQSLYGLTSIVGPTSLMLIFILSYLDVPYTTWLKYIWRFLLSLFIIVFAVLLILTII